MEKAIQKQTELIVFSKGEGVKIPSNFKGDFRFILKDLEGENPIIIGKNCEVTVFEESKGKINLNLNIKIGENSKVNYIELQGAEEANIKRNIFCDKNSEFNREVICVSGNKVVLNSDIYLDEDSKAEDTEIFFGNNEQNFELNTNLIHKGVRSSGDVLIKGILRDKAECYSHGILKINKGAQKSNTKLAEHVLLSSKEAKAKAIPALEVEADDVQAGHSASVQQIDGDQVFYAVSRGLSQKEAEKIIAKGFLSNALSRIENEEIKNLFNEVFEIKWNNNLLDVRKDFPILNQKVNNKPLVYLDSTATSQKPIQVINALRDYYYEINSNVHRGLHTLSEKATKKYEGARKKIADFINADYREVIFVRNTTEAINLVAHSFGTANIKENDTILTTEMEHHSNIVPWQLLAKEKKANLKYIPITKDGLLDLEEAERLIKDKPKILAVTHASNVLGTINPIKELVKMAHENNVVVVVDGAQSVPHIKVDVKDINCDFLAFSGHKMLGPTGIGVLYGKRELLERMEPVLGGGDMIKEVHLQESIWNDLPWKFEAGTPNIADAIALGVAVDYMEEIGIENIRKHEESLVRYALEKLRKIGSLEIYGPLDPKLKVGAISFNLRDKQNRLIHAHDLNSVLDGEGIAVRSGHMCCMPLMEILNVVAAARASFHIYNNFGDIDRLVDAIEKAEKIFNKGL